jgi:hypothetical protein
MHSVRLVRSSAFWRMLRPSEDMTMTVVPGTCRVADVLPCADGEQQQLCRGGMDWQDLDNLWVTCVMDNCSFNFSLQFQVQLTVVLGEVSLQLSLRTYGLAACASHQARSWYDAQ